MKFKRFCMEKENISKIKSEPCGRTYLSMIQWTRVSSPKYIKNSHDSTLRRQAAQLKNGQRTLTNTSPRRTYRESRDI